MNHTAEAFFHSSALIPPNCVAFLHKCQLSSFLSKVLHQYRPSFFGKQSSYVFGWSKHFSCFAPQPAICHSSSFQAKALLHKNHTMKSCLFCHSSSSDQPSPLLCFEFHLSESFLQPEQSQNCRHQIKQSTQEQISSFCTSSLKLLLEFVFQPISG